MGRYLARLGLRPIFLPSRVFSQSRSAELRGLAGAFAPASLPRFPVTAGNRWGTATRPLDSARFSRRVSQRWTAAQLERSPSFRRAGRRSGGFLRLFLFSRFFLLLSGFLFACRLFFTSFFC